MIVLNHADVQSLLPLQDCIDAARRLFIGLWRGEYYNPLRQRFSPEGSPNWITLMPALRVSAPALWCLKEMVVTPDNARSGMDPLQGMVLVHDGQDGRALGVVHAGALTSIRTAAVSAVATQTLARPDVRRVAVIGAGLQGRMHVLAMRLAYPKAEIHLWGRDPARRQAAADATGAVAAQSPEEAMSRADVVCTVTSAHRPFLRREWFAPGCHLTAVGSSTRQAREIDGETIAAASLFVDLREAALGESGDILGALRDGAITPDHIQAELGAVLAGDHPGRRSPDEFTMYKALGFAALDLMAAELVMTRARAAGRGVEVPW